ncbi:sugar ABC transporter substrate-binding protein [uncultured Sphaerochaeta sp.]|uniref:ABC transporter substrate-binding protein n=1 Tax=uncultured Sphaerochaeta sp. TaxID=886478 RepID=UPI002A0A4D80|nr:sugar ABC transporter substrate-binding protein [uncultured Sphaerochaeta sp.]
MKKLIVLFVVLLVCPLLFSNGTGEVQPNKPAKTVQITIWRPQNTAPIETWWKQMLDTFNERYAGTYVASQVTFPKGGAQGYEDKINTAVVAGSLPDLILVDGPAVASYAEAGIIVPLDGYLSKESKEDLLDSTLKQGSYDGKLYTLPLWESSVGIFYDKDVLARANIDVPTTQSTAWTWNEFYEVVKKLKTDDRYGCTFHTNSGQITYYYSPMLVQNGTDLISADGSTTTGFLNSPKTVEFLTYLKRFYSEKLVNIEPTPTEFFDGKSAMLIGTCYQISTLRSKYPDKNWGVTYYPVSNAGKAGTPTGSWTIGMTTNAKDKEATFALLDYMTNTEANISGCPASGYLPPRHSSLAALSQFNEEPYRVFMEQLSQNGVPRPRTPVWTMLNPMFNSLVMDVITGSDPQEKLDEAASKIDADYAMNYAH